MHFFLLLILLFFFDLCAENLDVSSISGIRGTLPTELGNLRNLGKLKPVNDSRTGKMEDAILVLIVLRMFYFIAAFLEKNVSALTFCHPTPPSIEGLRIHQTSISGTIPAEYGSMVSLGKCKILSLYLYCGCLCSKKNKGHNSWLILYIFILFFI